MLEPALFGQDGVPQHVGHLPVHGAAVEIAEVHPVPGQHRHVSVRQEEHVAGVAEDGGHVGRHKVLVVPDADHDRRSQPRGHDFERIGAGNHGQREHSGEFLDSRAHGVFQVPLEVLLDQVGDHLGVGFGLENVALFQQLMLERQVVLDDAVVNHHDLALAIAVGMGILLGGPPVRGPAGVANAEAAVHGVQADGILEVAELAFGAAYGKLAIVAVDGQPGGVVAPVLEAFQPLQNDGNGPMGADVANYAAHRFIIGGGGGGTRLRWASPGFAQSRISTRYSSITGLDSTSWAIVSISLRAWSRATSGEIEISKNLPWRTSPIPGKPSP